MQQFKGIKNLSELPNNDGGSSELIVTMFNSTIKGFKLSGIFNILSCCKTKGISVKDIFKTLFLLPFIEVSNIHNLYLCGFSKDIKCKKDAFYEFLNSSKIDWRRILMLFAKQFLRIVDKKSVDTCQKGLHKVLIIDDTTSPKSGKTIEFIGKVFDHTKHAYNLGLKVLMLGFWDGKSFIPLDFSIHNESGKNGLRGLKSKEIAKQFTKTRLSTDPTMARISEITMSKIDVALDMIKRAVSKGFIPKYVLADSWFITEDFIKSILNISKKRSEKINVIGMMKTNRIITSGGKKYKASSIWQVKSKQIVHCRSLKCQYIKVIMTYKDIEMIGYFVRMNRHQDWTLLVTTDIKLNFISAMKIYQIRWSIEVFFKDVKQNLNFGKCQSTDFDAHIATMSLCLMNYTMLTLIKRFNDCESLGIMFKSFKDKLLVQTLEVKLWEIFTTIYIKILSDLGVQWEMFVSSLTNDDSLMNNIKQSLAFLFELDPNNPKNYANFTPKL